MASYVWNEDIKWEPEICSGCLAVDRKVQGLKPMHYKICNLFLSTAFDFHFNIEVSDNNFCVCFECYQRFCNIEKFLHQVVSAQHVLSKRLNDEQVRCFSSLSVSTKTDYDYNLTELKVEDIHESSVLFKKDEEKQMSETCKNESQIKSSDDQCYDSLEVKNEDLSDYDIETGILYNYSQDNECDSIKNLNDSTNKNDIPHCSGLSYRLRNKTILGNESINVPKYKDVKKKLKSKKKTRQNQQKTTQSKRRSKEPKEFICDHCGITVTTKFKLEYHMRSFHLPIYCNICKKSFAKYGYLVKHNNYNHKKHSGSPELCYCVICDKQYPNLVKLQYHFYQHRHKQKEKLSFSCNICDKKFKAKHTLKVHITAVHLNECSYECKLCSKKYKYAAGYIEHVKLVHGQQKREKKKVCHICSQQFHTNRTLRQHIYTHTGERPFKCNQCSFAANQKYPLTQHILKKHSQVDEVK